MKEMLVMEKRELWRQEHPTIQKWLTSLKEQTQERYITYAYKYFMWIQKEAPEQFKGKTPEQLLDMQDLTRGRAQYDQVDLLQTWISTRNARYATKQLIKSTIYSFYLHNRVPLPRDITFKIEGDRPATNGEMSIEELKQIILSSNETYQAVFTIMWSSGMGAEEFIYFNTHGWSQLKEQLDQGEQIIRIDLPGRKHKRMRPSGNFFTFIGKDAIFKLIHYLRLREKLKLKFQRSMKQPNRKKTWVLPSLDQAIFVNEKFKPITKEDISSYFKRHSWRLGITKKVHGDDRVRYRTHAHEMRDTFKTELETVPLLKGYCIEFWMGHSIDANQYHKLMSKPDFVKAQYKLAEPYLNILSEDPRAIKAEDLEEIIDKRVTAEVSNLIARYKAREAFDINELVKKAVKEELEKAKATS